MSSHGFGDQPNGCKDDIFEWNIGGTDSTKGVCTKGKENLVCIVNKVLYMLKQSLRAWCHRIDFFYVNKGFCGSQANHFIYVKQTSEIVEILYVDDLIIWASNVSQWK